MNINIPASCSFPGLYQRLYINRTFVSFIWRHNFFFKTVCIQSENFLSFKACIMKGDRPMYISASPYSFLSPHILVFWKYSPAMFSLRASHKTSSIQGLVYSNSGFHTPTFLVRGRKNHFTEKSVVTTKLSNNTSKGEVIVISTLNEPGFTSRFCRDFFYPNLLVHFHSL